MPRHRPVRLHQAKLSPGGVIAFAPGAVPADARAGAGEWQADQLGWKGLSLVQLAAARLPVPPGFILPVALCEKLQAGSIGAAELARLLSTALSQLDRVARRVLGADHPPLYAVRCSPTSPMPGLMPTLLNVGMTEAIVSSLEQEDEGEFAYDCMARLIPAYAESVLGLPGQPFEAAPAEEPAQAAYERCQRVFLALAQHPFSISPLAQVAGAILAAVKSWNSPRAVLARRRASLPAAGMAVVVQAMVFGNRDSRSATGAAFTRDPSTGQDEIRGEYLPWAQGRDLFSGQRLLMALATMRQRSPKMWQWMDAMRRRLEVSLGDAQDFEFTIERGRLYLLQARPVRRSSAAAIRIAVELVDDGVIDPGRALARVDGAMIEQGLHPALDESAMRRLLARGLPASPGAACGSIAFTAEEAVARAASGQRILLVRPETAAADVAAMARCAGILTSTGGMTSHAAVVARGMGVPCIVGASDLEIDLNRRRLSVGQRVFVAGDMLTIDGGSGEVYEGEIAIVPGQLSVESSRLLGWADQRRTLGIYANADTPQDAQLARSMGAQALGLCRTEHMFFQQDRLQLLRRMILAGDAGAAQRRDILQQLLPLQREDFIGLLEATEGGRVTIRLLDPPAHEFLPRSAAEIKALAAAMGRPAGELAHRIAQLREANPMLGHRGCRLCLTMPELLEMQVRAIVEAAAYCINWGREARPSILLPMVMDERELAELARLVRQSAAAAMRRLGCEVEYRLGTMIEVPRAALRAAELARLVDFFSFGTNDLTQMACGISRDDSASFLPEYLRQGIFSADPFVQLDFQGVGQLVRLACQQGRAANPRLELGLCGEQGAEEATVRFCHELGMDYVSCSPYRVPAARLAAARAML